MSIYTERELRWARTHYTSLIPRVSLLCLLFLTACSSTTPTATGIPATVRPGPTLPQSYPTLPPTWTPTFTPSATDTPTITPRPSITPTYTLTPTLDAQAICEDFQLSPPLPNGRAYRLSHYFSMIFGSSYDDVVIVLVIQHRLNGKTIRYPFPGGQSYVLQLPLRELAGYGFYDWSLSLSDGVRRGLCEQGGYFLVYASPDDSATPEARPEFTPEATEES